MKRIAILILSALLLFCALPVAGTAASIINGVSDSDALSVNYTPQELLNLWTQIKTMLLINGSYPFSELEKGNTGYEVTALQTRLFELGFYEKEVVDYYGNGTCNAIRAFEKASGLTADGIASAEDQQALYSSEAATLTNPYSTNTNSNAPNAVSSATPNKP